MMSWVSGVLLKIKCMSAPPKEQPRVTVQLMVNGKNRRVV